uniref:UPF0246 protein n=1 Tax=Ascaris lumbricoides TaxID=6252 RepID=A0A0M3INQ1_ASCLU
MKISVNINPLIVMLSRRKTPGPYGIHKAECLIGFAEKINEKMSPADGSLSHLERIKLCSDRELFFINSETIARNLHERGFEGEAELRDIAHSDLTAGVYEGSLSKK